jgi:hypothetical protein
MIAKHPTRSVTGSVVLSSRRTVLGAIAAGLSGSVLAKIPAWAQQASPGLRGVELLRSWVAGHLPKSAVPLNWLPHVPSLGAGFYYPPTWQVTDIVDPNRADFTDGDPFGAWVVAPDQSAAVLMLNVIAGGPVVAVDAGWAEVRQVLGNANPVALAEDRYTLPVDVSRAFVAARAGSAVCATVVSTQPEAGTGRTYLYFNLVIALTEVFDATTERVFLPMLQNLAIGNPGNGGGSDSGDSAGGADDDGDDDDGSADDDGDSDG